MRLAASVLLAFLLATPACGSIAALRAGHARAAAGANLPGLRPAAVGGVVAVVMPDDLVVSPAWLLDADAAAILRLSPGEGRRQVLAEASARGDLTAVIVIHPDADSARAVADAVAADLADGPPVGVAAATLDSSSLRLTFGETRRVGRAAEPPEPRQPVDPTGRATWPLWLAGGVVLAAGGGFAFVKARRPTVEVEETADAPPLDAAVREAVMPLRAKLARVQADWRATSRAAGGELDAASGHADLAAEGMTDARGALARLRVKLDADGDAARMADRAGGSVARAAAACGESARRIASARGHVLARPGALRAVA